MDEIDKLLAQVKEEFSEEKSQPPTPSCPPPVIPPPTTSLSGKAFSLDLQQLQLPETREEKRFGNIDNLLNQVKSDFVARDIAEELQQQEANAAAAKHQEELKIQQQAKLERHAHQWLEELDPFSPEGLWFERFAEAYPSKLAAAIEYLASGD